MSDQPYLDLGKVMEQTLVISGAKPSWLPVTSSIPQGQTLEHMLFNVFINNSSGRTDCMLNKPVGDTKSGRTTNMLKGSIATQRDQDRREKWANRNLMKFSKNVCKVWDGIIPCNKRLGEGCLWSSSLGKDLWVCSAWRWWQSGETCIAAYSYLIRRYRESGARLFSNVQSIQKKRQQTQLGTWEIPIRYKEKYFYHESSEILEQASRKTLWDLYPWRCSRLD